MKPKYSRSVNRDHDPYKLPIGFASSVTVFLLVVAPFARGTGAKLACLAIASCVWITLGIIALSNHPGKE